MKGHAVKLISILLVVLLCVGGISAYAFYLLSNAELYSHESALRKYVATNKENIILALTEGMDTAKNCNNNPQCKPQLEIQLATYMSPILKPWTYMIRLDSEGHIERLYDSGEFGTKRPVWQGERQVYEYLTGLSNRLDYLPVRVNEYYTNMQYLRDLWSEAEVIVRVEKDGVIYGALIYNYGD